MMERNGRIAGFWILFGKVAAVLALLVLAWRLTSGEWFWIILNGILQRELG